MSENLTFFVGNRNPSITENIVDDQGAPIDLTAASVVFKARQFGSTALLVSATAVIEAPPTDGIVRYDWTNADATTGILSAARRALIWWEVTSGGKTQDVAEAPIEIRAHAPGAHAYVELEEFKSTAELSGQSYTDTDIENALVAASRGLDEALEQRFWLDPDATSVRYYSPSEYHELEIDPLVAVTSVQVDRTGAGSWSETWARGVDYEFSPVNAQADGKPYSRLQYLRGTATHSGFPCRYPNSVKITAQFGWPSVPEGIKTLTTLIAARLIMRTRQAPFGIISLGIDGATMRASQFATDPEYRFLTEAYGRTALLV